MSRAMPTASNADALKADVRTRYGKIASGDGCCASEDNTTACCGSSPGESSCCGGSPGSLGFGYSPEDLAALPAGADLGLGCGNPTALLALRRGEVVLD
ncbi:MAG: hypothetical protein ACREDE_10130, partial [Thermoplasmata archaeon]